MSAPNLGAVQQTLLRGLYLNQSWHPRHPERLNRESSANETEKALFAMQVRGYTHRRPNGAYVITAKGVAALRYYGDLD